MSESARTLPLVIRRIATRAQNTVTASHVVRAPRSLILTWRYPVSLLRAMMTGLFPYVETPAYHWLRLHCYNPSSLTGPCPSHYHFARWLPVGIDPALSGKPSLDLEAAASKAQAKGLTLRGVGGVAEELPFESESFDAVVSTLVFCSVRDPAAALREVGLARECLP